MNPRERFALWFRPAFYLGHNAVTLTGAVFTTSAALTLLSFWVFEVIHGGPIHPYAGIVFFLILPGVFVFGLVLIPLGALWRRHKLHGKFSYAEKFEYLAFIWGTVVMTLSGFLLWFDDFTLRHFPKWVADAATAVHYCEAILAALSVLVWHFYMVVFDPEVYPMDRAWLTGKASADHLRRTRPAYYLELIYERAARSLSCSQGKAIAPDGDSPSAPAEPVGAKIPSGPSPSPRSGERE